MDYVSFCFLTSYDQWSHTFCCGTRNGCILKCRTKSLRLMIEVPLQNPFIRCFCAAMCDHVFV